MPSICSYIENNDMTTFGRKSRWKLIPLAGGKVRFNLTFSKARSSNHNIQSTAEDEPKGHVLYLGTLKYISVLNYRPTSLSQVLLH